MQRPKLKDLWPEESRVATFDLSQQPEAEGAGGFENPVVTVDPATGLTVGTPEVTGDTGTDADKVRVQVTAVNPGIYLLRCEVDSHLGAKLVMFGRIRVLDPATLAPA